MLAHQVRQRAGLGEGDLATVAGVGHGLGEHVAAKSARWQEHHLAVAQMRRHVSGQIFVGGRWQRDDDQLRVGQGFVRVVGQ
ncbi:hypothetical protein D3C79_944810 [compost metagenome]